MCTVYNYSRFHTNLTYEKTQKTVPVRNPMSSSISLLIKR